MRKIKINRGSLDVVDQGDLIGFQMITYTIDFHGNEITGYLDTKVMSDGRQLVIDGDGWIKSGTDICSL